MTNVNPNPSQSLEPRQKQALRQEGTRPGLVFRPDVDILERGDAYLVYADLPGADEKSVDVRIEKGQLSIDARPAAEPDPAWTPLYVEYQAGGYHREFLVSEDIDTDQVSASMRNGVLELVLPKSARLRPRAIAVQGA